jgi:tRNA isopentenyl-2-thiomethyl-A-37 hydroxylase MiaE
MTETEALWEEIEQLRVKYYQEVKAVSRQFWDSRPSDEQIFDWLREQVWSEREGAKLHAYPVLKMADQLEPVDIRTLLRQGADEARHCELVNECLKARGGDIVGYEPMPGWKAVFDTWYQAADLRDPPRLFVLGYLSPASEGAAVATAELAIEGTQNTRNADIAGAYEKILSDESRHWGEGLAMLKKYAKSVEEVRRVRDLLRESAVGANMVDTIRQRAEQAGQAEGA